MNTKQQLQLVTFEQAKRLKEAGFDWFVYHWYNSDGTLSNSTNPHDRNGGRCGLSAPTVSLALKWFREEKKIPCAVRAWSNLKYGWEYCYEYNHWNASMYDEYDTHCNAESALLEQLLKLIEK